MCALPITGLVFVLPAAAQWNFVVIESGQAIYHWMPMTAFRIAPKEWAFELYGSSVTCPADLDGDGSLTIFDFLEFQNLFDAADPIADFDGDGELTIFDFLAFQNVVDLGCE